MNLREVTIGRANTCDIYLDSRCRFASNMHGTIYCDGKQLMYRDTSTNGTMINNINVHKRTIPINRGDIIMIAGKYPISWNQIDPFFPYTQNQQLGTLIASSTPIPHSEVRQVNTSKWNWGAFFLPGIWGLFNGCWWLIILQMLIPIPFLISIIAGLNGTKWAWDKKVWSSAEEFEKTQSTWSKAGFIIFCLTITTSLFYFFLIASITP